MQDVTPEKRMIFGVEKKPVNMEDPYHDDNLIVGAVSITAFGETEKGNSRQKHHRQLIQSIHDLHSYDPALSQAVMDHVMKDSGARNRSTEVLDEDPGNTANPADEGGDNLQGADESADEESVRLRTARERVQRWLVNQRMSRFILEMNSKTTKQNVPAVIAWAMRMADCVPADWCRTVAGEIVVMLCMPEIIVALQLEAEVGEYFEVTSSWHCQKGPLNSRAGFRMHELHQLVLGFSVPWWKKAREDPNARFPKTFRALDDIRDETKRQLKEKQVLAGIEAGYKQLVKMTDTLMSAPHIFLDITDPVRGPSLLRAILAVVTEAGLELDDDGDENSCWGQYFYESPDDRPDVEQSFYNLLSHDAETVAHYFQQFGFTQTCIQENLQRLSHAQPCPDAEFCILEFKTNYPVIFAALDAIYSMFPSNSRIAEQKMGTLRHGLSKYASLQWTDDTQQYLSNQEYYHRQERREAILERDKSAGRQRKKGSIRHDKFKSEQIMCGQQLLESGKKYKVSEINRLPAEFQKTITMDAIMKKGLLHLDKELNKKKAEQAHQLYAKRVSRNTPKTLDEWKDEAAKTSIGADAEWIEPETKQRLEDLRTLANDSFWKDTLRVKDGFFDVVDCVLPCYKRDKTLTTKKAALPKLLEHLNMIREIAKGKKRNSLSKVNLGNLGYDERLALFILVDRQTVLQEKRESKSTKVKRRLQRALFDSLCSTDDETTDDESDTEDEDDSDTEDEDDSDDSASNNDADDN